MTNELIQGLNYLEEHENLCVFLQDQDGDELDVKKYVSELLAQGKGEQTLNVLKESINKVENAITTHVGEHYEQLLNRVGVGGQMSLETIKTEVDRVQLAVTDLKQQINQTHQLVQKKYNQLHSETTQLEQIQQANFFLKRITTFLKAIEKLTLSMQQDEEQDAISAAITLAIRQVEKEIQEPEFAALSIVQPHLGMIEDIGRRVREELRQRLLHGVNTLNQAEIGEVLNLCFHLDMLSESVQLTIDVILQRVEKKCQTCFVEISEKLGGEGGENNEMVSPSNETRSKSDVWIYVQNIFDTVQVYAVQVWNLQRVLAKLKHPISAKSLLEEVSDVESSKNNSLMFSSFWEIMCSLLREQFDSAIESFRPVVKNAMISLYPRMRKEAQSMLELLYNETSAKAAGDIDGYIGSSNSKLVLNAIAGVGKVPHDVHIFMSTLSPFLNLFKDRSLLRMSNPVKLMFPQSTGYHTSPPSRSDIYTLINTIYTEIDQAGNDMDLALEICDGVVETIKLVCVSVAKMVNSGKQARVVLPVYSRSAAQAHNVSLLNLLQQLNEGINLIPERVEKFMNLSSSDEESSFLKIQSYESQIIHRTSLLNPSIEAIETLANSILNNYLQSIAEALESILSKMHNESFGSDSTDANSSSELDASGSKFMYEFSSAFKIVHNDHLKRLPMSSKFVEKFVHEFIARLLSSFVRYAALLRPLEESGKLRLASDMSQFELLLESVVQLKRLQKPYEEFRSFRHMIFLTTAELSRDPIVDKVRPSNVWHHLLSRGPDELQIPHLLNNWSVTQYVEWMETKAGNIEDHVEERISSTLIRPGMNNIKWSLKAEQIIWKQITNSLEAYAKRVCKDSSKCLIYNVMVEDGPGFLAGYEYSHN